MSGLAVTVLVQSLTDPEALEVLGEEGLDLQCVPDETLRPLITFALSYFYASGCVAAPSVDAMQTEFGEDIFADHEIDMEAEPADTIEWAVGVIKGSHVNLMASRFTRAFATDMAEASASERVGVLGEYAAELVAMSMMMERRSEAVDLRAAGPDIMRRYDQRAAHDGIKGLALGIPEVDAHIGGIRPSELAVLAAPPKSGKSFLGCWVALQEFLRGRNVVLFTLENTVDMMLNRIACMAANVDVGLFDRGECNAEEREEIEEWVTKIADETTPLWVVQPELGERGFASMVQKAQLRGADAIIVDQLSFVELAGEGDRRPQHQQIGDALHMLKAMLGGRFPMACLLIHQINRDGAKAAEKVGYLEMYHLASSAETERTADFVCGLYRSQAERQVGEAKFQILAARRTDRQNWLLKFQPEIGRIAAVRPITL